MVLQKQWQNNGANFYNQNMRNFQVITFRGVNYILVDATSHGNYIGSVANYERQPIPMPNFKGTGMALKGILRKNETLDGWAIVTGKQIGRAHV